MSNQDQEKNIAQGLSQLGETTTAAELLRQKGQTRKLRVISEKQLMDWILKMMQTHMAGKADSYSDIEKTEMLKKAQDEIGRRIKREREAQLERDRLKFELEQAMSAVAAGSSAQSQADIGMALAALKEKLEQAEQINLDLQQDNYDLQDQLNEKMALLSTTIAEKDKLRDTVRHQMMRMTTLCEGVLGIDNDYYGSRHQEENTVSDEASQDEQFYHDFDVGAKVITTLQADLTRLRGILKHEAETVAPEQDAKPLLESDLDLLAQLKAGSLHAVDVAAPVAGLLEAMAGARLEAETFEVQLAEATGASQGQVFTELPEDGGDPAEVLAGATAVTRELAASLVRNRNRVAALKSIADESDAARNATEQELDVARAAFERVCTILRQRAEAERFVVPAALADREASPELRAAAAAEVVDHLQAASPVEAAAIEQLALTDRLVKPGAPVAQAAHTTDKHLVAERLRKAGAELERYTLDLQRQLDEAGASGKQAGISAVYAEDRTIAAELIKASQGDERLAESLADLAIVADEQDVTTQPQLAVQVRVAVAALGQRKCELAAEVANLSGQLAHLRAEQSLGSVEALRAELAAAQTRERDLASRSMQASKAAAEARTTMTQVLAAELVKAGAGDPALAESSAALAVALDVPSDHAELESDLREAVLKLAARKRAVEADRTHLVSELESVRAERQAALARAEQAEQARREEIGRLGAELATLREELEVAQSDANEFRARNEATGTQFSREMLEAHQELTGLRARHQEATSTLATLRQQVEASETRLKRQREELTKGLEERDHLIAEKDRTIDQLSIQCIDAKALQAKAKALGVELDAANSRIRDLEARSGDQAGAAVRSGDLAELHKRTMSERDQLREQKRKTEAELAEVRSSADQLQAELAELRREHQAEVEAHAREVGEEREKNVSLKDVMRKLREEVVGAKARARKPGDAK